MMEEVVRKRVVGAIVLVILGLLLPLLLARCIRDDAGGDTQAMRVYEITPSGDAQPVDPSQPNKAAGQSVPDADKPAPGVTAQASHEDIAAEPIAPEAEPPAPAPEPESQAEPEPTPETSAPEPSAPETPQPTASNAEPENASAPPVERSATPSGWVVQVASFSEEANALALARELNDNYPAFYTEAVVDGNTYYRVRIGPFDDEAAADDAAGKLRGQGRNTLVQQVE